MTKKILIVEDNKDSREILGLFITKIGHQVIKACNSKEAITVAEAELPAPPEELVEAGAFSGKDVP